jgi:hypothetical protein
MPDVVKGGVVSGDAVWVKSGARVGNFMSGDCGLNKSSSVLDVKTQSSSG